MSLLFLDFETFYSVEYSLRRIRTTYEYVADPRFRVQALAACTLDQPNIEVRTGEGAVREWLDKVDWPRVTAVAHNAHFDAMVLDKLGYRPRRWLCTMQMAHARVLPVTGSVSLEALAKWAGLPIDKSTIVRMAGRTVEDMSEEEIAAYRDYVCQDVRVMRDLFRILYATIEPTDELRLIDWTIKQAVYPRLAADVDLLDATVAEAEENFARACKEVGVEPSTLRSTRKFAELLRELGVEVPTKRGKNGDIPAVAVTDSFMAGLREHEDETIRMLAEARVMASSNLSRTRAASFAAVARACKGMMPVPLHWHRARTGRWTGAAGLNMQNLPRGRGPLRRAIVAPPGQKLVVVDAAQIEARITAWLAGCDWLVEAFACGRDVYAEFASRLYGVEVTKQTHPKERHMGKLAVLSLGYGCGAAKFRWIARVQGGVEIDDEEAARIVATYRTVNHQIPRLWAWADDLLRSMAMSDTASCIAPCGVIRFDWDAPMLRLPSSRVLMFPGLQFSDDQSIVYDSKTGKKTIWGGYLVENIVQAMARDVLCRTHQKHLDAVVMQAHDELVAVEDAQVAQDRMLTIMRDLRTPPDWLRGCPLDVEGNVADRYGDAK